MTSESLASGIRAVLLDIEGTTTPVSFVFDVLFPYARAKLRQHLEAHAREPEYQLLFDQLLDERERDRASGQPVPPWTMTPPQARLESIARFVEWLMDRDRKSTALKELQGRIWEHGYACGELVGAVFPDVLPALERWTARRIQVAIFSSGSVRAQQLLFRHSSAGDLTRFLSRYFDTTTGSKSEPVSYQRIAAAMSIEPGAFVFASDVTRELDAARAAGMQTRLIVRPGNAPAQPAGHVAIREFNQLPVM